MTRRPGSLRAAQTPALPAACTAQRGRGGVPLWKQLKKTLSEMIREQALEAHARLPSEAELCRQFKVSRTVVREALAQMVNEGLIYRHQGKGAFVNEPRGTQDFVGSTVGFSGELAETDHAVSRRILRQDVGRPSPRIRQLLEIDAQEPIARIDRVLSVDGVPRAIVRWAMLERIVPGLAQARLGRASLYDLISSRHGVRLVEAERWIEAVSLDPDEAQLLEVKSGTAALVIESVGSDATGQAIEYYQAHYLTDRARLRFVVPGGRP